jgi:hypothetical protein
VSWSEDSWYAEVSSGGGVSTDEVEEDQWFRLYALYRGQEAFLQIKIVKQLQQVVEVKRRKSGAGGNRIPLTSGADRPLPGTLPSFRQVSD